MPPLPSPGKVFRCILTWSDGSDTNIQNHFYSSYTGSVSGADATAINNAIQGAWHPALGTQQTSNIILESVTTTDLATVTGVEVTTNYTSAGTSAGTKLSSGVAMVLSHTVARRFRGGHSRVYIPGLAEGALASANTWTATAVSNVVTDWTSIIQSMQGGVIPDLGTVATVQVSWYSGFTVVTSPTTGRSRNVPKLRTTPLVDVVTSVRGNPRVASQRRRNKQSA